MEMLYSRMPPGLKRVVTLFYAIVGISIFGLLAKNELKEIKYNMSLSRATEYLDFPIWPLHVLIMFVSLCLLVQFLLHGAAAIRGHTWPEENR
jgi:TRAP-type C4-dicarboxylate transport system permease small subunit